MLAGGQEEEGKSRGSRGKPSLTSFTTDHLGFRPWEGNGVLQEPGALAAREWLTSQYQAKDRWPRRSEQGPAWAKQVR